MFAMAYIFQWNSIVVLQIKLSFIFAIAWSICIRIFNLSHSWFLKWQSNMLLDFELENKWSLHMTVLQFK
jgi:hypothetical protein